MEPGLLPIKLCETKKETEGRVNMNKMTMVLTHDKIAELLMKEVEEINKLKLVEREKAKKRKQAMMDVMEEAKNKEVLESKAK